MVMKSGVDARELHLSLPLADAAKRVSRVGDRAIQRYFEIWVAKITLERVCYCSGGAPMGRRIFRMIGRCRQRRPIGVSNRVRIAVNVAIANRRYWPPKAVVIFCVPAADGGVGRGRICHRK